MCLCVGAVEEGKPFLRGHVPGKPHQHKSQQLSLASNRSGPRICQEVEFEPVISSADRCSSQTLAVLLGIEVGGWGNVPVVFGRPLAMTRWLVSVLFPDVALHLPHPSALLPHTTSLALPFFSYSALKHWDGAPFHRDACLKRRLCPGKRHSSCHSQAHVSPVTCSCWEPLRARVCGTSEWSASCRGCSKDPRHPHRGPVTHRRESVPEDEPWSGERPARYFCRSR